jgi:hypothetical protein
MAAAPGQITWTVLPAGWASDGSQTVNLSLVATPQLVSADPSATMADFPLFNGPMLWPDLMAAASFVVTFASINNATMTPNPAAIDSTLWKLVFPDTLPVAQFTGGAASTVAAQTIQSYSVQANLASVLGVLHQVPVYGGGGGRNLNAIPAGAARAASSSPNASGLAHLVPDTDKDRAEIRTVIRMLRTKHRVLRPSHFQEHAAKSSGKFTPEMLHFAEMDDYYSELSAGAAARYNAATQNQTAPAQPLTPPAFDFHAALSAISRYPALMRALGLILDFSLPVSDVVAIGVANGQMAMAPAANAAFTGYSFITPQTLYTYDPGSLTFCLASSGALPDLADGYFTIPPDSSVPLSLRLEALASLLPAQAAQFKRAVALDATATPAPLPAPTTAGLGLARSGENSLVITLTTMLQMQAALATAASPHSPTVSSETLVRGFRVDIQPAGSTSWFSLHQRVGTCVFNGSTRQLQWNDEGWAQLQAFNPTLDSPTASLWTHETIFLWQGWSLSAPRPGKMSGQDGTLLEQSAAGSSNLEFSVTAAAQPGKLPLLRFGQSYSCRLRTVDLAGYSLPLSTTTAAQFMTNLGTFLRYEPASPPVLLMRDAAGAGETNGTVVLRSDWDTPAPSNAERLIAPPSTSLHMAEWHGALDVNGQLNPALFSDPTFVARLNAAFSAQPYGTTPPAVPYLPDPIVTGAVLDFTPKTTTPTDPVTTLAFDGTWPALNSSRLILQEGAFGVVVDPVGHTVTVSLPKAARCCINLAAGLSAANLPLFDYWSQIASGKISVASIPNAEAGAINGRTTQLTPARMVDLVHAVQRPLIVSAFSAGTYMTRPSTFALMFSTITLDAASTGKAEVLAAWQEWVDDGINAPYLQSYQGSVTQGTVLLTDAAWYTVGQFPGNLPFVEHEFHDTKARQVTYTVVTTTRFMEFFPTSITDDPANVTQTSLPLTLNVPCAVWPPAPKVLYVVPLFGWQQSTDGSGNPTQRRSCGVRVYMDRPWYASGDGEQLGVVIPVTAPPPPANGGGGGIITRSPINGGGGGGPVLQAATVAAPTAPPEIPAAYLPFVTQWGVDPAVGGVAIPSPYTPLPQHFPGGTLAPMADAGSFPGFHFQAADTGVAVVSFPVQFEPPDPSNPTAPADPSATPNNGRWYADIEIDTGEAYFPFLRLALTRYQSYNSGQEVNACSEIVLADFIQIAANRSMSLVFNTTQPLDVNISVTGPVNPNGNSFQAQIEVDEGASGSPLWMPGEEIVLVPVSPIAGITQWIRSLTLPVARGSKPMRIVVREYETWAVDATGRVAGTAPSSAQRLVFVGSYTL